MWPFTRRKVEQFPFQLDTRPPCIYANCLILEMFDRREAERILRGSEPLTPPAHYSSTELPDFVAVVNRLKVISELDPVAYSEPRSGKCVMKIRGVDVILHTEFHDTGDDPRVHVRMKRLTS